VEFLARVKVRVRDNTFLSQLKAEVIAGQHVNNGFSVVNKLLYLRSRLVIPKKSSLIPRILDLFHSSAAAGHSGEQKTYTQLNLSFFGKDNEGT
jgi:hypothetical protein